MQALIDAGAYITWTEPNGLEMVAEFTRTLSGETETDRTISVGRDIVFYFTVKSIVRQNNELIKQYSK